MPRSAISDMLQVYRFWLVDVSPLDSLSIPILNPLMGFSSITAPEITSEIINIPEGNWYFQRKVVGRGNVAPIVLKKGASAYDRDFYNWIMHSISGDSPAALSKLITGTDFVTGKNALNPTPRRNLLLVQFFSRNPLETPMDVVFALTNATTNRVNRAVNNIGRSPVQQGVGSNFAGVGVDQSTEIANFGPAGFINLVPARAFMLYNCIPSKYKSSQDFDARNPEVSIQELTLEVEEMEQITLV